MKSNYIMKKLLPSLICFAILGCLFGCATTTQSETKKKVKSNKKSSKTENSQTEPDEDETEKTEKTEKTTTTTEATTTTEITTVETEPQTYWCNDCYEVVDEGQYVKYGTTYVVHKIVAKEDITVEATVIAYDANGDVCGKSSSEACLTAGKSNYFQFYIEGDITDMDMQFSAQGYEDSWLAGPRNAVEMVKWNHKGDELYITLEQVGELGSFSQIKVILYKEGKIVGTETGYIDIYAEGLTGVGSTDVADLWVYGEDFDDIEYIYEP